MTEKIRAHVFVFGRVQGVLFRETAKKKAQALNVFGWVKNFPDGRVEAVFEGNKENVEKMTKWAKRGPFLAEVSKLEAVIEDYKGEFEDFEIKYDILSGR